MVLHCSSYKIPNYYMKGNPNFSNIPFELSIRLMKMLTIGVYFAFAGVVGYIFAQLLSKQFAFDNTQTKYTDEYPNTNKGKIELTANILFQLSITGIVAYIARQFIQIIPWPFDGFKGINSPKGFKGFYRAKVAESNSPYPIMFFIMFYNTSLKNKIEHLTVLLNNTTLPFLKY